MFICPYEFHAVGPLTIWPCSFIFYSDWLQVTCFSVRPCGGFFPPKLRLDFIFFLFSWVNSDSKNTQQRPKTQLTRNQLGQSTVNRRSLNNSFCAVIHITRTECWSCNMSFDVDKLQDKLQKAGTMKAAESPRANKKDASTDVHKLIVHVDSCCCLQLLLCQFLKNEITNTWARSVQSCAGKLDKMLT